MANIYNLLEKAKIWKTVAYFPVENERVYEYKNV
jgi:hypothetical protein